MKGTSHIERLGKNLLLENKTYAEGGRSGALSSGWKKKSKVSFSAPPISVKFCRNGN
jgi:hypothetical protein